MADFLHTSPPYQVVEGGSRTAARAIRMDRNKRELTSLEGPLSRLEGATARLGWTLP